MGSYVSSWVPGKSETDGNPGDIQKSIKNTIINYLLSWKSVKTCGYCDKQLPTNGNFTTCSLCKEGFHLGTCSDRRSSGRVRKIVKKFSCPECFSWKVGSHQSAQEMKPSRNSKPTSNSASSDVPLHRHMRHMFRPPNPQGADCSSQEQSLKETKPFSAHMSV